jgi:DNA-binding transcriptional LysR family regulator
MAKLTDTQLIVLSAAAARDDGIAVVPAKMNRAAASKVGAGLVSRKLMREVRAKPGMAVWRQSGDCRPISLIITRAGRDAIGVDQRDHDV